MLVLAVPIGLLTGLSLGALGGGGSILTVPALVYLLDQTPHSATTGSLLIVGISALAGMAAHWQAHRVRVSAGVTFGLIGIAGSYAGSKLSASVDPNGLLAAFAALTVLAAAAMLHRARRDRLPATVITESNPVGVGPDVGARSRLDSAAAPALSIISAPELPPTVPYRSRRTRNVKIVVAASTVGLLTGFFGVGGGFVIVPALVLALGFSMPVAAGTSLLVIAINSAAALAVRVGAHVHLDSALLAAFTIAAVVGSVAGGRVASHVDATKLTVSFAGLLIAVALYTAARSIPHLI